MGRREITLSTAASEQENFTMDPYRLPFDVRDALLCLVFLVGIGAGVFAIIRKRQMAGLLTVAGFLLFSVDPIAEMVIFRVIMSGYTGDNFDVLQTVA
jgi:hypothetical protein